MRIRGGGWAIIPTCCWWEKPWFPSLKPSANITKRLSSLSVSSKALLFIHCYSFTSSSILRLKVSPTCWWLLRGVYVLVLACFGLVWSFILCLVFMFLTCMKSHGICLLSLLFLRIMIPSRSVHVVTIGKILFLFYSWVVFHAVCMCDIFLIHSSVDGHRVVPTSWLL